LHIGHPWLSRFFVKQGSNDQLVADASNLFRKEGAKPVILYSLQHLRDANGYPHSYAHIDDILEKYMKSEAGQKYTWWIRLHPILLMEPNYSLVKDSLKEKFGSLQHIVWDSPTIAPLPCVLGLTDLHFTRDSSLTAEAACFGIKTGFLAKSDNWGIIKEAFKPEIDSGLATILIINEEKDLISFIEKSLFTKEKEIRYEIMLKQNNNFEDFADLISEYIFGGISLKNFKNTLINKYS
jgi:hypothetical protein